MRDELLEYYERELLYLRRLGAEFAERYPRVAARLALEPAKCEDPHVERLLEGVAFLTARVHLRLDDDYPEMAESLLQLTYPHAVRPVPALTVAECQLDPEQGRIAAGVRLPRGTPLFTRPVRGEVCRFRTCYDTQLWPLLVADAAWAAPDQLRPAVRAPDAAGVLRLHLRCLGDLTFAGLALDTLRLHLAGDAAVAYALYELLDAGCLRIVAREPGEGPGRRQVVLPATALRPAGLEPHEGLLPEDRRNFVGYRLLQEYFALPEKFLFFDPHGLAALREAGFGAEVELLFLVAPFERAERRHLLAGGVQAATVRLGCTPVVNLFAQTAEPILPSDRRSEYVLVPDAHRRHIEVYSVDEVVGLTPAETEPVRFAPFYAHRQGESDAARPYWIARRRPTPWRRDGATEVLLAFADRASRPRAPEVDTVTARLTCHNGDLPARLPWGDPQGDFELQGGGPIRRVTALSRPTAVVQPPIGQPVLWRLVSQLSLNHLSLADGGPEPLRELLRLHDAAGSQAGERQRQGLVGVRGAACTARVPTELGFAFARGSRVEVDLDEEAFTGGGAYLFAAVLERFLALYASLNSFTVLAARTRQRQAPLRVWPPRAGARVLL